MVSIQLPISPSIRMRIKPNSQYLLFDLHGVEAIVDLLAVFVVQETDAHAVSSRWLGATRTRRRDPRRAVRRSARQGANESHL